MSQSIKNAEERLADYKQGDLLDFSDLRLSQEDLESLIEDIKAAQVTKLNLSYNKLNCLPESMSSLDKLINLNLSFNQFTEIPESVINLTQLKVLDVSCNILRKLPEDIEKLENLIEFNLGYNEDEDFESPEPGTYLELSDSIGHLVGLEKLNLECNSLGQIPETIGWIVGLTELKLGCNGLTELPDSFKWLTQLKTLDLRYNLFHTPPEVLLELTNLTSIDLVGNERIQEIPKTMDDVIRLIELDIKNKKDN